MGLRQPWPSMCHKWPLFWLVKFLEANESFYVGGEHTLLGTWKRQTSGSQPPILGGNFLGSTFQGSSVSCETVHGLCQNFVRQERLLPSSFPFCSSSSSFSDSGFIPSSHDSHRNFFQLLKRCCCPFKGQKHREPLRQRSTVLQNDTRSTLCFGGTRVTAPAELFVVLKQGRCIWLMKFLCFSVTKAAETSER